MDIYKKTIFDLIDKIELNAQKEYINELFITKNVLTRKIDYINKKIRDGKLKLIEICEFGKGGHNFVTEREQGMYGDTWTICSKCGYGDYSE